jgi:hypothetical protein
MKKSEINRILEADKIPTWKGYWTDNLIGSIAFFILPISFLLTSIDNLSNVFFNMPIGIQGMILLSTLLGVFMIYGYFTETRLNRIMTGQTATENREIIKQAMKSLNWKYQEYANYFEFSHEKPKFIQRFVMAKIIPYENGIAFNMLYYGSGVRGRWSHFLGIKTYMTHRLKKAILKATSLQSGLPT